MSKEDLTIKDRLIKGLAFFFNNLVVNTFRICCLYCFTTDMTGISSTAEILASVESVKF